MTICMPAAMVIHVDSTRATGNIAYGTQCNASVYGFKITLKGKGTHGAMPQDGIDPINAGVHLYLGLQELIARECNPCQDVVLTIGQFSAGNTANVIPNQTDSARTPSPSQRQSTPARR
ncbi:MAG TPA: peptidase dimerization domain-containing protein [Candidatus Ruminococcus avistercoris]|nr:peptidase dimerization domain-containing protein [Candidatus Ruminococcus avistercoris]